MPLNFPDNPVSGVTEYSFNGRTWKFNGDGWEIVPKDFTVPGIPQNTQTAAYQIQPTDAGRHINLTNVGIVTIGDQTQFDNGDAVVIFNNTTSQASITVSQIGAPTTLRLAGTASTGTRYLSQYGIASILCYDSNSYVISGAGLT
jgi:hypothetical protein